jgi:hypothetical protein
MIATAFAQQPTASIPQACGPGAGSKGAYRFFENETIMPHTIRQTHHQATLERVRTEALVLAIQDTTALNYSTHPQTQGLGPLGSHSEKTIGLFLHSTLAVTPTGQPLGLLHNAVRARDPKARGVARQRHRKPVAQKESQKWLDSLSACQALAAECPDTTLVNLTDREGDLYELFAQALAPTGGPRVHVLVRSRHNRRLQNRELRLWDAVGRAPLAGHLQVRVGRRGEQPARLATLSIRFSPVTLAPPRAQGQPTDARGLGRRSAGVPTAQRSNAHHVATGDDAAGNRCRGGFGEGGLVCAALADRSASQSAQERVSDRTAAVGNGPPLGAGTLGGPGRSLATLGVVQGGARTARRRG